MGSQSVSGESVSEHSALQYSAVWDAVGQISATISTLPLHLLRSDANKTIQATDKRLFRVMHSEFNKYMTAQIGREVLASHALTWGNAYAEKVYNGYGEIIELWPITPNRVRMEMKNRELIYNIRVDSQEIPLTRAQILHVPGLGFDGFQGYSVISMARKSIGLGMAMETFGAMYFGNGTHPGVIVSHPMKLDPITKSNLQTALTKTYSGLGQSHRLMLLEEGMKIENIGVPPEDSQFLECVVPETLITMANGTRKFAEDIKAGDSVIGWEDNKAVVTTVSAIGNPPIKNLIKIKTARGRELTASEDHPCLAILKLRTPGNRAWKENPEKWVLIKDLKVGSYVKIALEIPVISENNMTFDEGYFLGAMAGDGYMRAKSSTFTSADNGIIDNMHRIIKSFGGELKLRPSKLNKYNFEIKTNGAIGCKGGSFIKSLLGNSGLVGKHSSTKSVPESVIRGGDNAWKGFLSGYFDTDGSIRDINGTQKPAMYWSSTSLLMLQECQHLLAMIGIQSSIYPMGTAGRKEIMGTMCDYLPSWGLYVMGNSEIQKISKVLQLSHVQKRERLSKFSVIESSRYREVNFEYDRVISIEELGEGETVGIEIEGCHTHITNGIVTHNSRTFQISDIARWFHIPVHKLKNLERATNNNIESEQASYYIDCILPWLIRLEQSFDMQLLSEPEKWKQRLFFRHNVDGLLRANTNDRANYYKTMASIGGMTINDIRAKENMDLFTDPYADEPFIAINNMIPLSKVDEWLANQAKSAQPTQPLNVSSNVPKEATP